MPVASVPDLLDDVSTAQTWLDAALRTWSEQTGRTPPRIRITAANLAALRELRSHVRDWLTNQAEDDTSHPLEAVVSFRSGHLAYEPTGDGAVASLVLLEALLASHAGTLRRLKTCMNPACDAAFYDLSRNSTRVWHDMKNLRQHHQSPRFPGPPTTHCTAPTNRRGLGRRHVNR